MIDFNGLYNKEFFSEQLSTDHYSGKKLRFRIIENATVLPCLPRITNGKWDPAGGIVDSKGRFIKGTFFSPAAGGAYIPNEIKYVSTTVVFLGTLSVSWGHCITDSLRWLWFLNSKYYKNYLESYPVVYAIAGGGGGDSKF